MPRTRRSGRLRANAEWPPIVRDVLGSDRKLREAARAVLWQEVDYFVRRVVKLPIGPLNDQDDCRRDISVRVLAKLEAKSYAHLAKWIERQDHQRDHASFWGLVKTISSSTAIDYARGSDLNIAPRGEPFEWIRVDCADPRLLGEALSSPHGYLGCGAGQDVDDVLHEISARAAR